MSCTLRNIRPSTTCSAPLPGIPTEIQLMIWKYLVPNPRSIRGAILLVVDLDLGNPKAILPSIRDLKRSYSDSKPGYVSDDSDSENGKVVWHTDDHCMEADRRPILSLLHTCRASRTVALETYRLDLVSIIPEENTPLWNSEDAIVYFPLADEYQGNRAVLFWLSRKREILQQSLSSLQHIALVLDLEVASSLGLHELAEEYAVKWENQWLQNFPALQSFTFFIDPQRMMGTRRWSSVEGKILLYEPEDVIIYRFGCTASQIRRMIIEKFHDLAANDREVPLIEVFVTGVRKPKKVKKVEG